jgi:hypothetical protein
MEIDAGRANLEGPARSKTDLRAPKWLVRVVQALVPPGLGSPNELTDVFLETHSSISQAVLRIPDAMAAPAPGPARDASYLTIIATNVQAVQPILPLQAFLTSFLTVQAFTLGLRLQLNPLEGISRHQRIVVTLNGDPYIHGLTRRRYYLLTGADCWSGFSPQALLEMMFFILLPLPLLIGLAELYAGYPGAAEISAPQMAVNGAGWVALLMTWAQLKKLNRQTAAVFDQRIRELRANGR